jgi:hypothetical protein
MPRYRVIAPLPDVLVYRNGRVTLGDYCGLNNGWNWRAQRDSDRYSAIIMLSAPHEAALNERRTTGFDLEDDSPADKILRALVARGYAELLTAGQGANPK